MLRQSRRRIILKTRPQSTAPNGPFHTPIHSTLAVIVVWTSAKLLPTSHDNLRKTRPARPDKDDLTAPSIRPTTETTVTWLSVF